MNFVYCCCCCSALLATSAPTELILVLVYPRCDVSRSILCIFNLKGIARLRVKYCAALRTFCCLGNTVDCRPYFRTINSLSFNSSSDGWSVLSTPAEVSQQPFQARTPAVEEAVTDKLFLKQIKIARIVPSEANQVSFGFRIFWYK